jgi:hypothetical protein
MKHDCKKSTTTIQKMGFQRNSAETMDIFPETENMILVARTI